MPVRNRLKYFYLQLKANNFEKDFNQDDFAEMIGVSPWSVSQYFNHKRELKVDTAIKIWLILKEHFPDTHMEDLFDLE